MAIVIFQMYRTYFCHKSLLVSKRSVHLSILKMVSEFIVMEFSNSHISRISLKGIVQVF